VPCILRWPGKVTPGNIENDILSGLDWFPTFVAAAGNPNIVAELLTGKASGGKTYKVYLDGYNQRLHHPQGTVQPQGDLLLHRDHAVRISDYKYRFTDQPGGWLGNTIHLDWPILSNLRLDPFERYSPVTSMFYANWYVFEFWRFVYSRRWRNSARASSISRRFSRRRPSTSKPSRPRSPRLSRRAKASSERMSRMCGAL
jgi:arylsulfatase A-like enzyme